ncbi:hypothetical protein [Streptomyces misionensis]
MDAAVPVRAAAFFAVPPLLPVPVPVFPAVPVPVPPLVSLEVPEEAPP